MQLTLSVFKKLGWIPRSVGTPGRQWSGKHRRHRPVTKYMRKGQKVREEQISRVEEMIQFSYLTQEEAEIPKEHIEKLEEKKKKLLWQQRILGHDVFGLGAGKPSPLDHLLVTDTRRFKKEPDST